jgi:hypothetical protein
VTSGCGRTRAGGAFRDEGDLGETEPGSVAVALDGQEVAEVGCSGDEEAAQLSDAVGRGFGAADPVVEVHAALALTVVVGDLALDLQAGVLQERTPDAEAIAADVGRVAEFFDVLELGIEGFVFGAVVVDDDDCAAGLGDARHFAHGGGVVSEMVRGEADGDDVECSAGEGELLGRTLLGGDVSETALRGVLRGFGEHGFGEVIGDDALDVGRESESGVAGTGSDVEDGVGGSGGGEGDESVEGGWVAMAGADGVGRGGCAELGLDGFVDGCVGGLRGHES